MTEESGILTEIPKESKLLFEPEVSVKTEPRLAEVSSDNFDKFLKKAKKCDPMLLWAVLRPKLLNHVTLWDFLVDKTLFEAQKTQPIPGMLLYPAACMLWF